MWQLVPEIPKRKVYHELNKDGRDYFQRSYYGRRDNSKVEDKGGLHDQLNIEEAKDVYVNMSDDLWLPKSKKVQHQERAGDKDPLINPVLDKVVNKAELKQSQISFNFDLGSEIETVKVEKNGAHYQSEIEIESRQSNKDMKRYMADLVPAVFSMKKEFH